MVSMKKYKEPVPEYSHIVPESETYRVDLHYALNYASEKLSSETKKWKDEVLKTYDDPKLKKAEAWRFQVISKFLFVQRQGATLRDDTQKFVSDKIAEIIETVNDNEPETVVPTKKTEDNKPTVQDNIKEKISNLIAEIEAVIDDFGTATTFDVYTFLKVNNVKGPQALKIAEYYEPLLQELDDYDKDQQVEEAYSWMKKTEFNRFRRFIRKMVEDTMTWASNQKTVRKRKPKSKTAIQEVKSLKYMKEHTGMKLVSVAPESIVGAEQVWLFNTKTRILQVYYAEGPSGISVKGTTLQRFSEDSTSKLLRKPEETLPKVIDGGKRVLKKIMSDLTTKPKEVTGRVNTDIIILRIIK